MSAVQGANSPDKGVVQLLISIIAVLSALNRLMVGGASRVSGYLPAVTAEIIVILLAYFLLHQTQTAHNVPPDSGLQGGGHAGFIVNGDNAPVCQIPGCLPDG